MGVQRTDVPASPKDHDPIGNGEHVAQVVADHDHGQPLLAQGLDQLEDFRLLFDADGRGRLIENDDPAPLRDRLGNRDDLALPAREVADCNLR